MITPYPDRLYPDIQTAQYMHYNKAISQTSYNKEKKLTNIERFVTMNMLYLLILIYTTTAMRFPYPSNPTRPTPIHRQLLATARPKSSR